MVSRHALAALTSVMFCASPALAQVQVTRATQIGQARDFTVGVERLFGLSVTNNGGAVGGDFSETAFSIGAQRNNSPLTIPRLALDYYVISNLGIGGTLAFYEDLDDGIDGFIFAPRVGYAIPLNQKWTIIPRAGFTYYTEQPNGDDSFNIFAISLEGAIAFTVARNFGFLGSVTLDVSLTGSGPAPAGGDDSFSQTTIGVPLLGMYLLF